MALVNNRYLFKYLILMQYDILVPINSTPITYIYNI